MHNQTQLGQAMSLRCWAWTNTCQRVARQQVSPSGLSGLSRWAYKHLAWENRLSCKAALLGRCLDLADTSHRLPSNWWGGAREGHMGLIPFLRRDFTFRPWVTSDTLGPPWASK